MEREDNQKDIQQVDATYAAAHLPASEETPEASGAAEQVKSDGQMKESAPTLPGQPTEDAGTLDLAAPSPLIEPYREAAPFWHLPLEPNLFHDTPLIAHRQLADAERIVLQMESYLRNAGYEVEANELRLNYTQWVKTPATQYEQLRHELEPQRKEYQDALRQTQQATEQAQTEFVKAMAKAKIPFPEPPKPKKRSKTPPPLEPISPQLVEKALNADFASDDEVCGEQGVAPMSSKGNVWTMVGQWVLEFAAPLAAGLLLGVNLGVIVGLLDLEVLQNAQRLWLVAMAAIIGLFVEKLIGNTAYALASSAAQASERRDAIQTATPFPTMRSVWRIAVFAFVVSVLTIAIATVDALGLHRLYVELSSQNLDKSGQGGTASASSTGPSVAVRSPNTQTQGGGEDIPVPFWMFFIAGLIISTPYIIYKAVKGWREPEIRQREARIAYLHWKHIERRREEPAVQEAFAKAQEVQNLHDRRDWLTKQLEHIEARLDSARTECIGSTQRFREYWDSLIAWLSHERAPYADASVRRNGRLRRNRAQGETLLQKFTGLFRS